jgi:hypothetical protein
MTEVIMRTIKAKPRTNKDDIDSGLAEFCQQIYFTLQDAHASRSRFAEKLKQRISLSLVVGFQEKEQSVGGSDDASSSGNGTDNSVGDSLAEAQNGGNTSSPTQKPCNVASTSCAAAAAVSVATLGVSPSDIQFLEPGAAFLNVVGSNREGQSRGGADNNDAKTSKFSSVFNVAAIADSAVGGDNSSPMRTRRADASTSCATADPTATAVVNPASNPLKRQHEEINGGLTNNLKSSAVSVAALGVSPSKIQFLELGAAFLNVVGSNREGQSRGGASADYNDAKTSKFSSVVNVAAIVDSAVGGDNSSPMRTRRADASTSCAAADPAVAVAALGVSPSKIQFLELGAAFLNVVGSNREGQSKGVVGADNNDAKTSKFSSVFNVAAIVDSAVGGDNSSPMRTLRADTSTSAVVNPASNLLKRQHEEINGGLTDNLKSGDSTGDKKKMVKLKKPVSAAVSTTVSTCAADVKNTTGTIV